MAEQNESFGEIFSQYEKSHARKREDTGKQLEGTVVAVSGESVFVDIGYKSEGVLPMSEFQARGETPSVGDKVSVSIKGRNPEGYYELSRGRIVRVVDWDSLQRAFDEKATIVGMVTGVVKGGLSVDVGVRAFLPASRSGVREQAEMEKLVDTEIRCRITKLDVQDENVVVDRRGVLEEEERATKARRYDDIKEGDVMRGTVRSLADYGAFVDLGGVDGLLHVGEIAWSRVNKASDVLTVGQEIEAKVLNVDRDKRRIALSLKQLQGDPWQKAAEKYKSGQRVTGRVTRTTDFGAFVELEPGVEGLIHISEMSWSKRVKKAEDVVKPGETVEAVVLGISPSERRISLGLKQAMGDPWADIAQKFAVGSAIEGPVTSVQKFGAFVQLAEGVEGMIHVSEISAEKRINHPSDVLKVGQIVKAAILAIDQEKRQIRLGMKQLVPTSLDEYIAEHHVGDRITGRLIEIHDDRARVELGEGIQGTCRIEQRKQEEGAAAPKADLSSLSSMLQARWKGGAVSGASGKPEEARAGQIRSFRIASLDKEAKRIDLELA